MNVRRMADRWWIQVCPECNGLVGERSQTHNETCPNRHGGYFVVRDVEVSPVMKPLPMTEEERLAAFNRVPPWNHGQYPLSPQGGQS